MVLAQNIFGVKALTFDVFGTTVDWRGSLIREAEEWGRARGLEINWPRFADSWRAGYAPAMDQVRKGLLPWMNLDQLHRKILDRLFAEYKIDGLSETEKEHFNKAWHRLHPWPDSVAGLTRLKTKFILSTLSNGNVSLLVEMAKFAGLPWDAVLCAEIFRHYKPDSETYLGAAEMLGCKPQEVMMVAAHPNDLRAAQKLGLRAAFVPRPREHGDRNPDATMDTDFDVIATDFIDLAEKLGC
jgi:2-haloacid dehalogenase